MTLRPFAATLVGVLSLASACEDESAPPAGDPGPEHGGGGSAGSSGASGAAGGSGARGGTASGGSGAGSGMPSGGASSSETGGASPRGGSAGAGGEPGEGGEGADTGAGGEGGEASVDPPIVNGCTTYEDRTASGATRTLAWDYGIEEAPERCLRVSAGQSVTFAGNFDDHPLEFSPFASGSLGSSGDTYTVTFSQPGAWGFVCVTHTEMNGGIWVTP